MSHVSLLDPINKRAFSDHWLKFINPESTTPLFRHQTGKRLHKKHAFFCNFFLPGALIMAFATFPQSEIHLPDNPWQQRAGLGAGTACAQISDNNSFVCTFAMGAKQTISCWRWRSKYLARRARAHAHADSSTSLFFNFPGLQGVHLFCVCGAIFICTCLT